MKSSGLLEQQSLRILYADSDEDLQKKFLNYCRGHSKVAVTDGKSAKEVLERTEKESFDILILADNLPDMAAVDLLTQIRKQKERLPTILFSECESDNAVPAAGLADFCLKKGKQPAHKFRELVSLAQETAKRQQVLRELSEKERRLTDIINFLPDATLAIDLNSNVIIWNEAIETMTGIPAKKMLGKGNYEYSIPFYGERRPIMIDYILSGGKEIGDRYQPIRKQGNKIVVEAFASALNQGKGAYLWGIASPLYNTRGEIVGAIESIRDISDRRKTEDELRLSEEKNRSYIDGSPAGIMVFDAGLQFLDVNSKALEMTGYTRKELLKKRVSDVVPQTFFTLFEEQREILFDKGELVSESILERKDGTTLPIFVTVTGLPDHSYLSFVTDISELETIRAELKERETLYRALFDNISDSITLVEFTPEGIPGTFIEANPGASRLLGYTHEELLQLSPQDVDAPETRSQIEQHSKQLIQEGHTMFEGAIIRKDGARIPVEISPHLFEFLGRKMLLSVVRDISDRKKIETKLRESEALYRTLFENITDAVFLHGFTAEGLPGKFTAVNEAACRQLGYTREELLRLSVQDIEAPSSYAEAADRSHEMRSKGHAIFESLEKRKDGTIIPTEVSSHVFMFRDQQVVLSLARDITERKEFENQLRESEKRYSSLFYQNFSISLLIDPDTGRIVDANTSASEYYGYSSDELKGVALSDINGVPEEKLLKDLREAKKEREKHFFSVHRLADGRKRNVEVYSGPIIIGGKKLFYSIIHDITDKKEAEDKLIQLLGERTTLLKEIHHRVNNNLQVLLSLATLEKISYEEELSSNALADKLLSDMENRITAIALVHENLFLSGDLTEIRLVEHLKILAQTILTSVIGGVFISYEVEGSSEIVLELDQAVLVSLVASEILTNVQKHAFADQTIGNVSIRVTENSKKKQLLIEIADDGVGLPEDLDPEQTESVGLSLIYNIITFQLHGTVTINREKGTAYQITLSH